MSVKKIVLNSAEIASFLKEDQAIHKILLDEARAVKAALPSSIEASRSQANSSGKNIRSEGQEVFLDEDPEKKDRQKIEVGIKNAQTSDFLFGSIPSAVEKAGGKKR